MVCIVLQWLLVLLMEVPHFGTAACVCSERASIVQSLYAATNGASWIRPWDMSSADVPCGLEGVTCDAAVNDITKIEVAYRGLTGTLPDELGGLAMLEILTVASNALSGSLPDSLGQCKYLRRFDIYNNSLSGTLPAVFSAWTMLSFVSIGTNLLTGSLPKEYSAWGGSIIEFYCDKGSLSGSLPTEYQAFVKLSIFRIASNSFSGTLPASYSGWSSLIEFSVGSNEFTGTLPPEYSALSSLTTFDCSSNNIEGTLPSGYSACSSMTVFGCSNNLLEGTLPPEYSRWSLPVLVDFGGNQFVGTLPPAYSNWKLLQSISLADNKLDGGLPLSYSSWASLYLFWAFDNNITGTLPVEYELWTKLQRFRVNDNQLQGTLPAEYSAWMSVTEFDCSNNLLTGTLPPSYSAWSSVSLVNVSANTLTGSLPAQYSAWANLAHIYVAYNHFTGSLPREYGNWSQLNDFDCSVNSLVGTLPTEYSKWTKLWNFLISRNMFIGTLPGEYSAWRLLDTFECFNNSLSGTLPPAYGMWPQLRKFNVRDNFIAGTLPPLYQNWSALKFFDGSNNQLTGSIPREFQSWTTISTLRLSLNRFTGVLPPEFSSWVSLTDFRAHQNNLTGSLPPQYGAWTSVVNILCNANSISGTIPSSYGGMQSLKLFDASSNLLTGTIPQNVVLCPQLQIFSVGYNGLDGVIPPRSSPTIRVFSVQYNKLIAGSVPPQLFSAGIAVAVCGTLVCPASSSGIQVCLPQDYYFSRTQTFGDILLILTLYRWRCDAQDSTLSQSTTLYVDGASTSTESSTRMVSGSVGVATLSSILRGGGNGGNVASLQRSASVLRLASWCDASRTLNADNNEQLFTDVSDNPLGLSLPVQSVPLATAAGAAVGNALLVLVIGIAQHGLHVVQHHTAVMVLPLPLRSFIEQFPSSMLPGSLSGSYGSFMQPSLEACLVLLVSSQKSTAAWACGAVMIFVWLVFPAYCVYVILYAGRLRRTFVLKGVRCEHAILHLSSRNHTALRSRSKQYFYSLSHIQTYLMNATSKWAVRPATTGTAAQRREKQRIAPKQLLERMEGVFEGYVDRREWFFMVRWGLSILGGVVLGALTAMASDDASAACRASLWAAGVALLLGVAEVVLCVLLCPFTVRLELVATVTGLSLGVVGNALVLGGEDDVAGGVVSAAAVLELAITVLLLLNGFDRSCTSERSPENMTSELADGNGVITIAAHHPQQQRRISDNALLLGVARSSLVTTQQHLRLSEIVRVICDAHAVETVDTNS